MTVPEIDHLTEEFYKCISFREEHYPAFDRLEELFYGAGKLIDASYDQPPDFTVQSFSQAMMKQIEEGNASFFVRQEISDRTEVSGNMATRVSTYEYSSSKDPALPWKHGTGYIQFIFSGGRWLIVSLTWSDERN